MHPDKAYRRLSDKILEALELSIEQEDVGIAEILSRALELTLTRNAGGDLFVERRSFSDEIEEAFYNLTILQKKKQGQEQV